MNRPPFNSTFLQYLASANLTSQEERLPALQELSKTLGISVSALREQLEVARALGLVEVRPRTGMRRLPYSFFPAVQKSLFYAIQRSDSYFQQFAELRNYIEASYWDDAVSVLQPEDLRFLSDLMARAWSKLRNSPPQIPHEEHRLLHLTIFSRLNNPFVQGILEAYWDAYEAVGLNVYTDLRYLEQVWQYHQDMVDALCDGDYAAGFEALVEHKDLLTHRPNSNGPENKL